MPRIKKRQTTAWIKTVAKIHERIVGDIGYMFVDDEKILQANKKYLSHDYYTDIITFDYSQNNIISGDILISIDRIKDNAYTLGKDFQEELYRVIIHGILHLCGIEDKTIEDRQIMEAEENRALNMLKNVTL